MNRIEQLFINKRHNLLTIYFTAGFPALTDTVPIIQALDHAGADLVEIGIPFSDPMADGTTIQESNACALTNGMCIPTLLEQLKDIRKHTQIPLLLMGYFNPIYKYGVAAFCADVQRCGIDGLIIPDLPLREYNIHYRDIFERHGLSMCFLITSATSEERIREIDALPGGFIYFVSSPGVTGRQLTHDHLQADELARIAAMHLRKPVLAGFGIGDRAAYETVCRSFNGAIIGSSFIRALEHDAVPLTENITQFIQSIRL